jgi:hypothetical protein
MNKSGVMTKQQKQATIQKWATWILTQRSRPAKSKQR